MYILMLVVEMSFEVSKSIVFVSSSCFISSTVPLMSYFWMVKSFYMVSLPTKLTMLLPLELDLRIGDLFQ